MARQAEAEWKGDLKGGSGRVKLGSGAYEGNYSFATRFEDGSGANARTSSPMSPSISRVVTRNFALLARFNHRPSVSSA